MKRRFRLVVILVSLFGVPASSSPTTFAGQDSPSSQSPSVPPATDAPATPTETSSSAEPKKTKKVWTNENLKEASGSAISQTGNAKNGPSGKGDTGKAVNSQGAGNFRDQLSALQTQLSDIDKQIAYLKRFSKGEAPGANGMQLHKRYNTEPIPYQVQKLEEKRKSVAAQIDAVFDAARKRGIEPGQLP